VCLATVYVERNGEKEEVMRDVGWIKPEDGGLRLIDFMGQDRLVQGEIKDIDLMKSSIVLVGVSDDLDEMASDDRED
jgi:predicted RNA-binding protein